MSRGTDAGEVLEELDRSIDLEEDRAGKGKVPGEDPKPVRPAKDR